MNCEVWVSAEMMASIYIWLSSLPSKAVGGPGAQKWVSQHGLACVLDKHQYQARRVLGKFM